MYLLCFIIFAQIPEEVAPQQKNEEAQYDISKTTECEKENELLRSEPKSSAGQLRKASHTLNLSSEQDLPLENEESNEIDLHVRNLCIDRFLCKS